MGLIGAVRDTLRKGSPIVGTERGTDWYDDDYSTNPHYRVPYYESRYYPVWSVIVDRIRSAGHQRVLEVGCGSGQLAAYIVEQGGVESYTGVDFSRQAIELARQMAPKGTFRVGDATDPRTYDVPADCIVCTEVLEHIDEDLAVLSRFPSGVRCLCTVPDFPYPKPRTALHVSGCLSPNGTALTSASLTSRPSKLRVTKAILCCVIS